jgi:P-type E1-E2 ATPase
MLAFARAFDHVTQTRAKRIIQSLMKYHVENVRVQVGETVIEKHISEVKAGDVVVVESGDRMPVDGTVISGEAEVDESSLTGGKRPCSEKSRLESLHGHGE